MQVSVNSLRQTAGQTTLCTLWLTWNLSFEGFDVLQTIQSCSIISSIINNRWPVINPIKTCVEVKIFLFGHKITNMYDQESLSEIVNPRNQFQWLWQNKKHFTLYTYLFSATALMRLMSWVSLVRMYLMCLKVWVVTSVVFNVSLTTTLFVVDTIFTHSVPFINFSGVKNFQVLLLSKLVQSDAFNFWKLW